MCRVVDHPAYRTIGREGRNLYLHIVTIIVGDTQIDVLGKTGRHFLCLIRRHRNIVGRHSNRHRRRVTATIAVYHLINKTVRPRISALRRVLHNHTVLVIGNHVRREIISLVRASCPVQLPPRRILLPKIILAGPDIIASRQYQRCTVVRAQAIARYPAKLHRPRHLRRQIHIDVIHTICLEPFRQCDCSTRVQ